MDPILLQPVTNAVAKKTDKLPAARGFGGFLAAGLRPMAVGPAGSDTASCVHFAKAESEQGVYMQVNAPKLKAARDQRGWSQEHLAKAAGLGLRTIQRVEAEASASHETLLCIAAALELEVNALIVAPTEMHAQSAPARRRSSIAPDDAPWYVRRPLFTIFTRREAVRSMRMQFGIGIVTGIVGPIQIASSGPGMAGLLFFISTMFGVFGGGLLSIAIHWMDFHECWGPTSTRSGDAQL